MRPQGFGQVSGNLEDLGWNDMGFEPPKPAAAPRDDSHDGFGEEIEDHQRVHPTGLTPVQSPVHSQQAEIVHRFNPQSSDEEIDETAELYEPGHDAKPDEIAEPVAEVTTVAEPVAEPVEQPVEQPVAASVPHRAPRSRAAPGSKAKAAFTLRLAPDRHLKLRLACAVNGRSAQQLVTDALDKFLEAIPELDAMADKAKRRG
jgi:hypothetical protein